jgi:hypothetical protein
MDIRVGADIERAGIWLGWFDLLLRREREIFVNGRVEFVHDLRRTFALEGNRVTQVEDMPIENTFLCVVYHFRSISLIRQQSHGFTPASRRKSRTS